MVNAKTVVLAFGMWLLLSSIGTSIIYMHGSGDEINFNYNYNYTTVSSNVSDEYYPAADNEYYSQTELYTSSPIPKDYYAKADEMSTDQETHTLKTLSQTLMDVKLPAYTEDSFMCGHASAYLEWYLEGAGFDTEIVDGKIHPSDVLHAWIIVKLPEGDVAVEAVYLCEDNYHPPGIIMDPAHKFKDYSTDYQEYLRYLKEYSTGEYILPKNFDDFMKNYIDGATYSNEDYYDSANIYNEYEDIYDATENLLGLDWWENKTLWQ